jgi:hypothetical protein
VHQATEYVDDLSVAQKFQGPFFLVADSAGLVCQLLLTASLANKFPQLILDESTVHLKVVATFMDVTLTFVAVTDFLALIYLTGHYFIKRNETNVAIRILYLFDIVPLFRFVLLHCYLTPNIL